MDDAEIHKTLGQIWSDLAYILILYQNPAVLELQKDLGRYECYITVKRKINTNKGRAVA